MASSSSNPQRNLLLAAAKPPLNAGADKGGSVAWKIPELARPGSWLQLCHVCYRGLRQLTLLFEMPARLAVRGVRAIKWQHNLFLN